MTTEHCRIDECSEPARFIVWGKFFKPEHLGPRCRSHLDPAIPISQVDQYAVLNLGEHDRHVTAKLRQDLAQEIRDEHVCCPRGSEHRGCRSAELAAKLVEGGAS